MSTAESGLARLKAFARSPHHLWLAALTLGAGLASAHPIGMVAGAAAYLLGWIYLPDSGPLRRWRAKRQAADALDPEEAARATAVLATRKALYQQLNPDRQARYRSLAAVVAEAEAQLRQPTHSGSRASIDAQMQPMDSLMATYLRLLHTGQVLDRFITGEEADRLEHDAHALRSELNAHADGAPGSHADLAASHRARLETLEKRLQKLAEARTKLRLTRAEAERVEELVKLARAEFVTANDPASLQHRIDTGARQMADQSAWTEVWDESGIDPAFDLSPGARVGYELTE